MIYNFQCIWKGSYHKYFTEKMFSLESMNSHSVISMVIVQFLSITNMKNGKCMQKVPVWIFHCKSKYNSSKVQKHWHIYQFAIIDWSIQDAKLDRSVSVYNIYSPMAYNTTLLKLWFIATYLTLMLQISMLRHLIVTSTNPDHPLG